MLSVIWLPFTLALPHVQLAGESHSLSLPQLTCQSALSFLSWEVPGTLSIFLIELHWQLFVFTNLTPGTSSCVNWIFYRSLVFFTHGEELPHRQHVSAWVGQQAVTVHTRWTLVWRMRVNRHRIGYIWDWSAGHRSWLIKLKIGRFRSPADWSVHPKCLSSQHNDHTVSVTAVYLNYLINLECIIPYTPNVDFNNLMFVHLGSLTHLCLWTCGGILFLGLTVFTLLAISQVYVI